MDWGAIAVIVFANVVTTGLALALGLRLVRSWIPQDGAASVSAGDRPLAVPVEPKVERTSAPLPRENRPASMPISPRKQAPRGGSRKSGLEDHLAPYAGAAGGMSDDQLTAVRTLLGRSAQVRWMSGRQADVLLAAGDYAEAVIESRIGARGEFGAHRKVVRRLALVIVADDRARSFVIDWAAGRYARGASAADPLEEEIWTWAQDHAGRLLGAEGSHPEAA